MKKEVKLARKINRFLRRLGCPRFLHHFGPKKYELFHHIFALLAGAVFHLSLRRLEKMLRMFEINCPTYSALCKSRKRIPTWIWEKLMKVTAGLQHKSVAIDATGFSRVNPSYHYLKRIDRKNPVKRYAKLSMLFGIENRKVIAIHVRTKPRHDLMDVEPLLGSYCRMQCLLADKGYDAEWLHEMCFDNGIQTIIPQKRNIRRGYYRRKQSKNYSEEKYHQRSLIESGFSAIKRKYSGSVSGKRLASIYSELSCKAIAYNLRLKH